MHPPLQVKIHDKTLGEILKPHELHSVAMAAQFKEYAQGQVIIRQGDAGDAFYMIAKGGVDVYIREKSDSKPVVTLPVGAFFGEKALLGAHDVRSATCVAAGAAPGEGVKCLLLMREDFVRMLGDLGGLMERAYDGRKDEEREKKAGQEGMVEARGKVAGQGEVHPEGLK